MIVRDFTKQNQDILISRLNGDDFLALTTGSVLFCITTYKSNKPLGERIIQSVGYQMVADIDPETHQILTVTVTASGYVKVDYLTPENASEVGNKQLFHCKPLPANDPRRFNNLLESKKGCESA